MPAPGLIAKTKVQSSYLQGVFSLVGEKDNFNRTWEGGRGEGMVFWKSLLKMITFWKLLWFFAWIQNFQHSSNFIGSQGKLSHLLRGIFKCLRNSKNYLALLHILFQQIFWCLVCQEMTQADCPIFSSHPVIQCAALPTGCDVGTWTLYYLPKCFFTQICHGSH